MDQAGVCLGSVKQKGDRLGARRNRPPIAPAKPRSLGPGPAHVAYFRPYQVAQSAPCHR
jgi:hypothetical protein